MCLESGDYIQIKNAILVLQGILPRFPTLLNLCSVIEKRIEKVSHLPSLIWRELTLVYTYVFFYLYIYVLLKS